MAPASVLSPLIRFRDPSRNSFNSSNCGRAYWARAASRRSGRCPRELLSMTKRAAIRSMASSAIGKAGQIQTSAETEDAFHPLAALPLSRAS
jgi:hypothetical protein